SITLGQNNAITGTSTLTGAATSLTNTLPTTVVLATTGATSLTATGQPLTVSGTDTSSLTTSAAATSLGTLSVGSASLTATGAVTQTGVLTDAGALTVSAAGQSITRAHDSTVTGKANRTAAATSYTNVGLPTTVVFDATCATSLTAAGQPLFPYTTLFRSLTTSAAATSLGTLSVGSASLTATGAVTQTGVLTDAGALTVSAAGQ